MPAKKVSVIMDDAVRDVAVIILVIGGSGALTQLLHDSKVSSYIATTLQNMHLHPLILAWGIAAIIRVRMRICHCSRTHHRGDCCPNDCCIRCKSKPDGIRLPVPAA